MARSQSWRPPFSAHHDRPYERLGEGGEEGRDQQDNGGAFDQRCAQRQVLGHPVERDGRQQGPADSTPRGVGNNATAFRIPSADISIQRAVEANEYRGSRQQPQTRSRCASESKRLLEQVKGERRDERSARERQGEPVTSLGGLHVVPPHR
jgi:hypothetical protein